MLKPDTNMCLSLIGYEHSETKHSCLIVNKNTVVAKCFRHEEREITGDVAKALIGLFFDTNKSSRSIRDVIPSLMKIGKSKGFVRKGGYIFQRNQTFHGNLEENTI